jgi:hypothetical protein
LLSISIAQPGVPATKWSPDGNAFFEVETGEIVKIELPSLKKTTFIGKQKLMPNNGRPTCSKKFSAFARREQSADIYQ